MTWERGMILVIVTLLYTVLCCYGQTTEKTDWPEFNQLPEHMPYFFRNNPGLRNLCSQDETCPYKYAVSVKKCWGFELNCSVSERMKTPVCDEDSQGLTTNLTSRVDMFWKQADFGFVKEIKGQLKILCPSTGYKRDSSLTCTKYLRYCRGENFFLDMREGNLTGYIGAPFKTFPVGGKCPLKSGSLAAEGQYPDLLDSWFGELGKYSSLGFYPAEDRNVCDISLTSNPTLVVKFDPGNSMYINFFNFINVYISLHTANYYQTETNILQFETGYQHTTDFYGVMWNVFTKYIIKPLNFYFGKRMCIKDIIFTNLPRAGDGFRINMSLVSGCNGSSLVRAFSQYVFFRLQIPQEGPIKRLIRVTMLSTTARFKNILNQNELVSRLRTVEEFKVQILEFSMNTPFLDQLKISHNSDILIGMNGDALTHVVYQPDWAVMFEIYNCNDNVTYFNLARLRGIKYMTWENKDKMVQVDMNKQPTTTFPELSNYSFNKWEFMRLVLKAAHYVRTNPDFIKAWKAKYRSTRRRRL